MMISLIDNLKQAGKTTVVFTGHEASRIVVLPAYGRALGLYAEDSDVNFFWTNPVLATAESAKAYFRRDGWCNPGGDRTWLAPEIDLFIGDLARPAETYAVPSALDPGRWRHEEAAHGLRLRNESSVQFKRGGRRVNFALTKEYRPAANPLRDMKPALSYAGYEQSTILELDFDRDGAPPVRLGVWNLLQLPKPGRMIVPTCRRTAPRAVFGEVPPEDLALGEGALVWTMPDRGGNAKISVKAAALTGRAGYLCRSHGSADLWNLMVRNFVINPSGDYVDAPWDNPAETGYAFQACAVNEGAETFNELEYHAPAAETAGGRNRSCDQSQLWAFRGRFEEISTAVHVLLGIDTINHRVLRNAQFASQVSGVRKRSFVLNPEHCNLNPEP